MSKRSNPRMVRVPQRKKKKLQSPITTLVSKQTAIRLGGLLQTMTFQAPTLIIAPSVVSSRNKAPATTLVLEQPMIRTGGFLPVMTFQVFAPNIECFVAPFRNMVGMLGFAVFSTIRAPVVNSSTLKLSILMGTNQLLGSQEL